MNQAKITDFIANLALGQVVSMAVDKVAPQKAQQWPSYARVILVAGTAVGLLYAQTAIERKLGIEDDDEDSSEESE